MFSTLSLNALSLNALSLSSLSLNSWITAIILNTVLLSIAWLVPKKLLTPTGYLHAWGLGVLIWGAMEWQGYIIVLIYFAVGSAVTRVGMAQKEAAGIAEGRAGTRGPENVWGSALIGALCALGFGLIGYSSLPEADVWLLSNWLQLAFVASFSTKLADTCASEIGKAYGSTTYLITTFQPTSPGTEGAVSLEGTVAGILAAVTLACISWLIGLTDILGVVLCSMAAFIATNLESVIGATLQDRFTWLTNELVNIINTLMGATIAVLLAWGLSHISKYT